MNATQNLVGIYLEDGRFEARRIIAVATYRDPDEKGTPNYTVPLHAEDLTIHQVHEAVSRRILHQRLPVRVVDDGLLWDALDGHASLIVTLNVNTGRHEVQA